MVPRKGVLVLPGKGLGLGISVAWLGIVVVLPLAAVLLRALQVPAETFLAAVASPEAMASYGLTLRTALVAAGINALMGTILAWILVRYSLPAKGLINMLIDLPFALPGAVSGIALAAVLDSRSFLGAALAPLGIRAAYSELAVYIALLYAGLPFVVRAVQPVLEGLDRSQEEAASLLGASRFAIFRRIILPALGPAILSGATLAFARGLGEYGTVIFVSSNIPLETVVTSRHLANLLEAWDMHGAAAVALVALAASLLLLAFLNWLQLRQAREGS